MFKRLSCLVLVGLILGIAGQAVAELKPIVYFSFDALTDTIIDGTGNGHDGTPHGTLLFNPSGNFDGCFEFNGSDAYVELPRPVQDNFTLAGWIKTGVTQVSTGTNAYNGSGLFWADVAGNANDFVAAVLGDKFSFFAGNPGASITSSVDVTTGDWVHVAAVRDMDNSVIKIFINGQLDNSVGHANTGPLDAQAMFAIGANTLDRRFYTGLIDDVKIYDVAVSEADIYSVMSAGLVPAKARKPQPANDQTDVPFDTVLSWTPGKYAVAHDVYFGTQFEDVNAAERTAPMGVLVSQGQNAATYEPDGSLDFGTTYYWRIDEVNAAPDNTIYKGDVWSFTTEPFAYPITNIEATSNGVSMTGSVPDNAITGLGLNDDDQHSTDVADMWLASPPAGEALWLQCAFDKVYKLHQLQVWNHNSQFEAWLGYGIKDVTIEHSVDGVEWMVLGDYVLGQAPGTSTYTANTLVDLEGVAAQYVRFTVNSAYMSQTSAGLSEIRFLYLPVQARVPEPADGAVDVDVDADLAWRGGRDAAQHDIYLDTTDGTTLVATTEAAGYEPGTLNLGTTYYWKVDETNNAEAVTVWEGSVWSFSTQDSFLIEDFEAYDDDVDAETTIWQTWIDGIDDSTNGGAVVGYDQSPFAEQTIVYDGGQSMPLRYNNTSSPYYSEADRTFSTPQNWAKAGITTLVIHFRGDFDNAVDPIYAVINGTRVDYDGGAEIITRPIWKQWNIDLAGIPNLQNVRTLSIGVGGGSPGGTGILYVDSIRLYREAPESATPTDPGTDGLGAYYAFEGNLNDASGNGYTGMAMDSEVYNDSYDGSRSLSFDGINDYAELPIGPLVASADSMTVAAWYHMLPNTNSWQRLFDFGTSGTEGYMFFSPQRGTGGGIRFAIEAPGSNTESMLETGTALSDTWHHMAIVIDSTDMSLTLYIDGAIVATGTTDTLPSDLGQTTQNWLGRSQYDGDGYFVGLLDELRIYDRALSTGEVRYLTGDR